MLVLGATGFIGSRLTAALAARGHAVSAPRVDFVRATDAADWKGAVRGMEVVVNAVGILRERGKQSFAVLHDVAPRAVFAACQAAGVRRVVQVSALGADEGASSRFHISKKRADDFLAQSRLDWVIVRPSLVFGPGGASARLFAMLASLPVVPLPGDGGQRVQPVHIDDLADLLLRLVEWPAPLRRVVPAVGPREVTLREWLGVLRAQMGLPPARFARVPLPLVPLDRETLGMLQRGNTASAAAIGEILGRAPRDIKTFIPPGEPLALRARLDWLLPLLRFAVAVVWVAGGAASLAYPVEESLALLRRAGLEGAAARTALYGGALLDIALGMGVYAFASRGRRWLWRAQLALLVVYSAIIAWWLPEFWLHPFGPLVKNVPLAATIVLLHELEER